jgi:hypothetical protein
MGKKVTARRVFYHSQWLEIKRKHCRWGEGYPFPTISRRMIGRTDQCGGCEEETEA